MTILISVTGITYISSATIQSNLLDKLGASHMTVEEAVKTTILHIYILGAILIVLLLIIFRWMRKTNEKLLGDQMQQIDFIAHHDKLTGLPNRCVFTKGLEEGLQNGHRGAILLLDIDNFKNINDALGHTYGDKVLQYVADLLKEASCEHSAAYRFGGDEFLINIKGESDAYEESICVKSIIDCFETSHWIEGIENYISVSIGIVRYPQDGECVEELLKKVEIAMFNAKRSGKDKHVLFGDHMTSVFLNKLKVEKILRKALEQNEFKLVYQPIIKMETGEIQSLEALIRIQDNIISPGVFIPIAEETGLILAIGRWVIKEAIGQLREWIDGGYKPKPVAINLSPKQIEDKSLLAFLKEQIKENNIDPSLLEIEITEGILLENKDENIRILEEIQALGISISLDDFGTGYSSLNSLTYIPVNKVKLDKSLKDKFIYHESSQVLGSIIALIHSLNLEVIIEGVEEPDEFMALRATASDYLQGYLFSKPLPPSEIKEMFNNVY